MLELACCSFDALAKSVIFRYLLYSFVVMIVHTTPKQKAENPNRTGCNLQNPFQLIVEYKGRVGAHTIDTALVGNTRDTGLETGRVSEASLCTMAWVAA